MTPSLFKPRVKQENISPAQKEFLAAQLLHQRRVSISRIMLFILFLALWELAAAFSWIDPFIFSSPVRIGRCLWTMALDGTLFLHTGVTLGETVISFFLVVVLGLAAALLLWLSPALAQILEPCLVMLNSLPKSALAPLLIVWLGSNTRTVVVAAVSVALFGSILTLHTGFCQTDPDVLTKVLLPSSVPLIISSMKVNIGLCLVGVIIGEFLSSRAGLGYLIIYSSQVFQMNTLVASIIILCLMSAVLYQGIHWLEKKFL